MNDKVSIECYSGSIQFAGIPRCWDDCGRNAFKVWLTGRPPLYGEWREIFDDNEIDFHVEIVGFGYLDERNLSNPHPNARLLLSEDEISSVRNMIESLFSNTEATKSFASFASPKASYNGSVFYQPGWVLR